MRSPFAALLLVLSLSACDRLLATEAKDPPPAPETQDVCQHVRLVASKQEGANSQLSEVESDCTAALERVRKHYETLSTCLLNTNTLEEVLACEQPMRTWTSVVAKAAPRVTAEAVCDHVLGVMKKELGQALPMSEDDTEKFRQECITEMNSEKTKMGTSEFAKKGTCVMEAASFADMERCDKK